jgi:hypothetical protein
MMQGSGEVGARSLEQEAGAWSQVQRVGQAHYAPAEPSPLDGLHWLVYVEGGPVVGPVSANQVARGIREGRVPTEASIQAVGEVFWTGLLDEPAIIAALKSI